MKTLELFSGVGGLSLGLRRAGFDIVAAVEINRDAAATYALHHRDTDVINKDVSSIDFSKFRGAVAAVVGGPPCQPFSLGGLRKGHKDKRDMLPQFIRCLEVVRPEFFIMENVPGLATKAAGPYFANVLERFQEIGYRVNSAILNAADFGLPQKRRRLFVLGALSSTFRFPMATHGPGLRPYLSAFSVIHLDKPIGEPPNCSVKYAKFPDLRPSPYAGHVYNGGGRPLDPHGPAHTILASSGGYKTHWVDTEGVAPKYHAHLMAGGSPYDGVVPGARRLSVQECALLQTFPLDMIFCGRKSSQYTQVGDAVPPKLAEVIGTSVMAQARNESAHLTDLKMVTQEAPAP